MFGGRRVFGTIAAAAMCLGLLAPAAAAATATASPSPPTNPTIKSVAPGERPSPSTLAGLLLSSRPVTGAPALPSAARNYSILYLSTSANSRSRVVSGTVAIPKGVPPAGGWPVVSWAHGTTGVADVCAPSRDTNSGPAHDYLAVMDQTLDKWVTNGFVVVQTDYEGLGTPGPHPYIIGDSQAHGVIDIVRAARQLDHRIGRDWVTIGHSQGGQAALFVDEIARNRAPGLNFLGAVAIAPASFLSTYVEGIRDNDPAFAPAVGFLPLLIQGAAAVDPRVRPDQLLSPLGRKLYQRARTTDCIGQLREFAAASIPADQIASVFESGAATERGITALVKVLQANEPGPLKLKVPVLMVQGDADGIVTKPHTDAVVQELCANGAPLQYDVVPGADHRSSVTGSFNTVKEWVADRQAGIVPPSGC